MGEPALSKAFFEKSKNVKIISCAVHSGSKPSLPPHIVVVPYCIASNFFRVNDLLTEITDIAHLRPMEDAESMNGQAVTERADAALLAQQAHRRRARLI